MSGDPLRENINKRYCITWYGTPTRWMPWRRDTESMWWKPIGPLYACKSRAEALLRIEWDEFGREG